MLACPAPAAAQPAASSPRRFRRATTSCSAAITSRRARSTRRSPSHKQALTPRARVRRAPRRAGRAVRPPGSRGRSGRHGRGGAEAGSRRTAKRTGSSDRSTRRSPNSARGSARTTIPRSTCRERLRRSSAPARTAAPDLGLELTLGRLYLQIEVVRQGDSAAAPRQLRAAGVMPRSRCCWRPPRRGPDGPPTPLATLRRALERESEVPSRPGHAGRAEREAGASGTRRRTPTARAQALNPRIDLAHPPRRRADQCRQGRRPPAICCKTGAAKPEGRAAGSSICMPTALRQTGDLAGAEDAARRLRTAAPDDPRGMYVLAQVLEAREGLRGR